MLWLCDVRRVLHVACRAFVFCVVRCVSVLCVCLCRGLSSRGAGHELLGICVFLSASGVVSPLGFCCGMPVSAIPLSFDAALVMDLRAFIGALDDDDDRSTTDAVVNLLMQQQVRSTRRLASTPVRLVRLFGGFGIV